MPHYWACGPVGKGAEPPGLVEDVPACDRGLDEMIFEVPPNPNHSVVLLPAVNDGEMTCLLFFKTICKNHICQIHELPSPARCCKLWRQALPLTGCMQVQLFLVSVLHVLSGICSGAG